MKVVVVSHIQGTFLGYAPGVVHRLDDGSEWEQTGDRKEYVLVLGVRPPRSQTSSGSSSGSDLISSF